MIFPLGPLLQNVAALSSSGGGASPTTLDPATVGGTITFTNGNLTATTVGGSTSSAKSTNPITAGALVYFEGTVNQNNDGPTLGIINGSAALTTAWFANPSANVADVCPAAGVSRYNANVQSISGAPNGTVIGVAYNDTTKKLYTRISGTWQNSADPVAGTGGLDCTGLTGTLYAAFQGDTGDKMTLNFGATAYANAAPTGFGNI